MSTLHTFLITGRTEESELGDAETPPTGILSTVEVNIDSDGFLRFTDSLGRPRSIAIKGDVAVLVKAIFTGEDGLPENVMMFDRPVLTGPGVGGRTDPVPQS